VSREVVVDGGERIVEAFSGRRRDSHRHSDDRALCEFPTYKLIFGFWKTRRQKYESIMGVSPVR
jgi:hypothetical protein